MLHHPNMSPIALDLGQHTVPLLGSIHPQVHWYGLMYLCAFAAAYWLCVRWARLGRVEFKESQVDDIIFHVALGVIVGGRLGYVFFYGFDEFLANPLWALQVWSGGMSFHGGFLGVMLSLSIYCKRQGLQIGRLLDFACLAATPGLGFGRIGNFIGQELWGRPTDVPWAMLFPHDPLQLARHPSQLYQAFLEGFVLFCIMYFYLRKPKPVWSGSALFLMSYGLFRFMVEFVREPDAQIGFDLFGWMSRGQILSLPMIAAGILLMWWSYQRAQVVPVTPPVKSSKHSSKKK